MTFFEILLLAALIAATVRVVGGPGYGMKRLGKTVRKTIGRHPLLLIGMIFAFLVFPGGFSRGVGLIVCASLIFYAIYVWVIDGDGSRPEYACFDDAPPATTPKCEVKREIRRIPPPPQPLAHKRPPQQVSEYPERSLGWFGGFVRATAMLFLLAFGGYFFLSFSVHEVRHGAAADWSTQSAAVATDPRLESDNRFAMHTEPSMYDSGAVSEDAEPAQAISTSANADADPMDDLFPWSAEHATPLILSSPSRSDPRIATEELESKLRELARLIVQEELEEDVDFWSPPASWLRQTFGDFASESVPSPSGVRLVEMSVEIDIADRTKLDTLTEAIISRFRNDQRTHRALKLAKGYAGAVLILGGLAIFLRLGTGQRPIRAS